MVRSLWRTLMGPSRDPRMAYISRPLPRYLPDAQVVTALEKALAANPDPAYLVETLGPALREVTGREYEILDRSVFDVTGSYGKTMVMIRDGDVGHWPGYDERPYAMVPSGSERQQRDRLPGWEPPATPSHPDGH
jgi:hypothetical protein